MPVDGALPPWISVDDVQSRLEAIFAPSFPDRTLLVGRMAARVVFEFLYGGCIETRGRYLRPSQVYLFTDDQAALKGDAQRIGWYEGSLRSGHRAPGRRWYADTSREPRSRHAFAHAPARTGAFAHGDRKSTRNARRHARADLGRPVRADHESADRALRAGRIGAARGTLDQRQRSQGAARLRRARSGDRPALRPPGRPARPHPRRSRQAPAGRLLRSPRQIVS